MQYKVGFIGCGNMGGALLSAVINNIGANNCCVCEKQPEKTADFVKKGVTQLEITELSQNCEFIFLAVKPQALPQTIAEINGCLNKNAVIITMAAGTDISTIQNLLDADHPIIRIMPNMPCAIGKGIVLYCHNALVSNEQKNEFLNLLNNVGLIDYIDQEKIDAASVISGCGPAFAYMFLEALANATEACGLNKESAVLYATHMLEGAALMVKHQNTEISDLITAVCSPKGTTIEGVEALRNLGFYEIVEKAVRASYNRTKELKG